MIWGTGVIAGDTSFAGWPAAWIISNRFGPPPGRT